MSGNNGTTKGYPSNIDAGQAHAEGRQSVGRPGSQSRQEPVHGVDGQCGDREPPSQPPKLDGGTSKDLDHETE